jgi:threonine synthase
VLPAGNLGNTSAVGAALRDASALGLVARVPRVAAVQAAGAAPFARAFAAGSPSGARAGRDRRDRPSRSATRRAGTGRCASIRDTDGVVTDVGDDELLAAKAAVDAAGVGCEPASAASVAGVRRLVREGVIRPGESAVAILTGHVLKDPGILLDVTAPRRPTRRTRGPTRRWRSTPPPTRSPRAGRRGPRCPGGQRGTERRAAVRVPDRTSNPRAGFDCVGVAARPLALRATATLGAHADVRPR